MSNKNLQLISKTFFMVFLSINVTSLSWASNFSITLKEVGAPDSITQVGDNVFAQTSDVTIKLEKKMPKAVDEWPNSIETAKGAMKSSQNVEDYEDMEDPLNVEDYEDMEDPFAGTEKDIPILTDPFEGYNRWMFGVNEAFYEHAMEPFVRGYRDIVHEDLRIGLRNVYNNATAPAKFASSLFQLEFGKAGRVLARTFINTVFGFGGYADVAGEAFGINDVNEDFDQVFGNMGIPTGPYIVLPFFGPATARNVVGRAVDTLTSPGAFTGQSFGTNVVINAEDQVNQASFILDDKKQLEESALDEYESVRDFYHQFRHGLLKN